MVGRPRPGGRLQASGPQGSLPLASAAPAPPHDAPLGEEGWGSLSAVRSSPLLRNDALLWPRHAPKVGVHAACLHAPPAEPPLPHSTLDHPRPARRSS